jgi:hypothetical protein
MCPAVQVDVLLHFHPQLPGAVGSADQVLLTGS